MFGQVKDEWPQPEKITTQASLKPNLNSSGRNTRGFGSMPTYGM